MRQKRQRRNKKNGKQNYYLEATWMILAAFSRNPVPPTHDPVAPAIINSGFSTFPFLKDGTKSGKHDRTPCNDESIRRSVTFKWSFSFPVKHNKWEVIKL